MPAILVTGPAATQDSLFLPQQWLKPSPVLIVRTHGGIARLSGSEWPRKYGNGRPAKGGRQS